MLLENAELRGSLRRVEETNTIQTSQLVKMRRVLTLQQEATQVCGDLLASFEGGGDTSYMSSLQSGDVSNNLMVESNIEQIEQSVARAHDTSEEMKSDEESRLTIHSEQENDENDNQSESILQAGVSEEEEVESDESDFDPADLKLRKSTIQGRQSLAPQREPEKLKQSRKTQRMTRGPRKRSSIITTEQPTTDAVNEPATKRKTIGRRTVNFNFGLDESVDFESHQNEVTIAMDDTNKENMLQGTMQTPVKGKMTFFIVNKFYFLVDNIDIEEAGTRSSRRNRKKGKRFN